MKHSRNPNTQSQTRHSRHLSSTDAREILAIAKTLQGGYGVSRRKSP